MLDSLATTDPRIRLERGGALARLTVDRSDKHKALDYPMVLALEAAAHAIETSAGVRAAILTGAGDTAFCAACDIAARSGLEAAEFGIAWVRHGHRALDALARLPSR